MNSELLNRLPGLEKLSVADWVKKEGACAPLAKLWRKLVF